MSIRIKEINRHYLLKKVLLDEYNIKDYKLVYNENGKPTLMDKKVHFNLSSSENISALVTGRVEVGICIKHYFYDSEIEDICFNQKEKEIVRASRKKEEVFTRIYTLKIAYIKMLGLNKDYPLIDIDTTQLKNWQTRSNKDYIASVLYNKQN